jgi:hypothetical protein
VCAVLVEAGLVYPVWRVHAALRLDWTLAILLADIITVAINGTLRVHLLFTSGFNPSSMREQLGGAAPIVRGTDVLIALLLLLSSAAIVRTTILLSATLAAFAVGWAVVSLIVEPATVAAAFRSAPELTRRRPD